MGYGQTACLVALAQIAAEGRTRDYHKYRTLTKERKSNHKNEEYQAKEQGKGKQKAQNLHTR